MTPSAKPRVLVTRALPEAGMARLFEHCDVTVFSNERQPTPEELHTLLHQHDALLCTLVDKIDRPLLEAARPKVVSNYAVGYDNIDIAAATELGIPVTNTPGVLTNATAEIAWALLMAVTRRIVEADLYVRDGKWTGWSPLMLLGTELAGKTLGIIGCGRIGLAVAKRAKAFEMNTLYYNRRRLDEATEREYGLTYAGLDALLAEADVISLHMPYSSESHHMINRDTFRAMKKTAFLINTARGSVVDEAALVEALRTGEIAGAGLDVFEAEPAVHPGLLTLPNVVLAPHLGSATLETRTKMAEIAVQNVLNVLKGELPVSLVNPDVWPMR
ncbi:D-glycerate dehydrogenase [Tumebacillus avium]|uniref:D-glycerate dehydrogenase n=1 Tax=Tumebacillus avium TaxID=1903704 RepID=A0A1Y0IR27_9BACL|nr:D-glycerate dehydrogenase [Tumebacillus avium]ARU63048.1 D-glycerate dehydrogenase [Tumebacillus avium]